LSNTGKRHTCKVCGTSCSTRVFNKRHGENCDNFIVSNRKRGTLEGYSNYWINLDTGVIYKLSGKLMKSNINARGNRVVNLTHDDGSRRKINLDREWMKLKLPEIHEVDVIELVRQLTAENKALKRSISSEVTKILTIYFNDLCPETWGRSLVSWTNFIMMSDNTLDRETVKATITTVQTGRDRIG
jgi:hypothetical protein